MSVEAQTVEYSYTGDGTSTVFQFPARFLLSADITVGLNGVKQNSGYTVTGAGQNSGGTVVFSVAPAVGVRVTLLRAPPASQLIDFINGQTVLEDTLDNGLDKLTMIAQYLLRGYSRSVRVSDLDQAGSGALTLPPVAERASKLLGFDVNGGVTAVTPGSGGGGNIASGNIIDASDAGKLGLTAGGGNGRLSSRSVATTTNIPVTLTTLTVDGFAAAGDRGAARYKRLVAAPGTPKLYHFQSADGAWWELDTRVFYVEALGAVADYVPTSDLTPGTGTLCDAAIIDALAYAGLNPKCIIYFNSVAPYGVTGASSFFVPDDTTISSDHTHRRADIYRTTIPVYTDVFAIRDPAGLAARKNVSIHGLNGVSCDIDPVNITATAGQSVIPYTIRAYETRYDFAVFLNGVYRSASTPSLLIGKSLNQIYLTTGSGASLTPLSFTATAGQTVFNYPNSFSNVNQIIVTANSERVTVASYTSTTVTLASGVPVGQAVWVGALDTSATVGQSIRVVRSSASALNCFINSQGVSDLSLNRNITVTNCRAEGVGFYIGFTSLWTQDWTSRDCIAVAVFDRGHYCYGRSINCEWYNSVSIGRALSGVLAGLQVMYYAFDNNPWNNANVQENIRWVNPRDEFCLRGFAVANWVINFRVTGHTSLFARSYGLLIQDVAGVTQPDYIQYDDFFIRGSGDSGIYGFTSQCMIQNGRITAAGQWGINMIEGNVGTTEAHNSFVNVKIGNCTVGGVRLRKQIFPSLHAVQVVSCPIGFSLDATELAQANIIAQACSTVGLQFINASSRSRVTANIISCGQGVNLNSGTFYNKIEGYVYANTTNWTDAGGSNIKDTGDL